MEKKSLSKILSINDKTRYVLYTLILLFMYSVKYKIDNQPKIVPFFSLAIIFTFALLYLNVIVFKSSNILSLLQKKQIILFLLFILFIFISIDLNSNRGFKDFFYAISWSLLLPLFILTYKNNTINTEDRFFLFTKSILFFSIFASVIAILTFLNIINLEIGNYVLKQNYWTSTRIHGFLGDPTAFGALIGFCFISLSYLHKVKPIKFINLLYFLLILMFILSGSRNAIISCLIVIFTTYNLINKTYIFSALKLILLFLFLEMVVLWYLGFDILYVIFFRGDLDSSVESSRFYIWNQVVQLYLDGNILNQLFGYGTGSLGSVYRASFNSNLEYLYDYGIFGLLLYNTAILFGVLSGVYKYKKTSNPVFLLGIRLIIFGYAFGLFFNGFPTDTFHFSVLSLILGLFIVAINIPHVKKDLNAL